MKVFGIAVLAVATMMMATDQVWAQPGGGATVLRAKMLAPKVVGQPDVILGHAHYEAKTTKEGKTLSKLGVGVKHLTLAVDTKLNVLVNGVSVGAAIVKSGGATGNGGAAARLELVAARGDKVPVVKKGDTIAVQLVDGTPVASGQFQPVKPH